MPRRRALRVALLAAILFGTGLLLVYVGRYKDCLVEEVWFTTHDDVRIHAALYLPKEVPGLAVTVDRQAPGSRISRLAALFRPGSALAFAATPAPFERPAGSAVPAAQRRAPRGSGLPAVIFTHGLLASHEHYETAYSLELAKRGIAVLALDYRGHGDSGGGMGGMPLAGIERYSMRARSQPDLLAAYEYLLGRPEIDSSRIAFAGHSMGGFASTDAAIALRDGAVATVAIGAAPLYVDIDYPLNFYLLNGARDEFFGPSVSREVIARATEDAVRWEGTQYGRFEDGTARRLDLIPWVNHITEAFSPKAATLAIRWLESAFYGEPRGEIHTTIQRRLAGVALIVLGLFLGFGPMLAGTERLCLGPRPAPAPAFLPRRVARRRAAGLIVVYFASWGTAAATGLLLLASRPLRSVPILLGGPVLGLLYGGALNLVIAGILLRGLAGRGLGGQSLSAPWASAQPPSSAGPAGPAGPPGSGQAVPGSLGRLAFGILPFLYVFGAANLGLDRHFMDYWPSPQKWMEMAVLLPLLAPPLAVNEWWLRRWILPLTGSAAAGVLVPVGTASGFYLAIKLLTPLHLGLFSIAIAIFMGILVLPIAYARTSPRRREVVGPWIFHVLTAAWLLAIHLPPR